MINLIVQSYLTMLVAIGCASLLLFSLGVYGILKLFAKPANLPPQVPPLERAQKIAKNVTMFDPDAITDVTAIAGDDVLTTKLDLARAFIETGNLNSAKAILLSVCKQGNADQQQEAKRLLQFT